MANVNVSLSDDLNELDQEARRRSTSRSALLAAAARRELARPESGAVAEAVARSERRFRTAGSFDAAELVRRHRDDRPARGTKSTAGRRELWVSEAGPGSTKQIGTRTAQAVEPGLPTGQGQTEVGG